MMRLILVLTALLAGLVAAPLPWLDDGRALRCPVSLPALARPLEKTLVSVRDDLAADPALLGLATAVDPASLKILEVDRATGRIVGNPSGIPYTREGGLIFWQANPGSATKTFYFYCNVVLHPRTGGKSASATMETPAVFAQAPDYAREQLGHAWDFDDGETAGIFAWGDTPQAIQNRKVEGGILSFDAVGDPWFTWGSMFSESPWISLDPSVYNLLLIRVRQSVASAPWQLFCLDGNKQIRQFAFTVTGKDWQMLRFDIPTELRWKGPIKSLRIDPTDKLRTPAHIEIDWVRVVACAPAARGPVESRFESASPAALRLEAPASATAGEAFQVRMALSDGAGKPASFVDVTLRLASEAGGAPREYRALTGASGEAVLSLSNARSGEFKLAAFATLAPAVAAEKKLRFLPAAAVALAVDPGSRGTWYPAGGKWVMLAREGETVRLDVRMKDAFGNLVSENAPAVWEGLDAPASAAAFKNGAVGLSFTAARSLTLAVERGGGAGLKSPPVYVQVSPRFVKRRGVKILPNGYFGFADGRVFFPLGGHYANWPGKAPDFKANIDFFPCNISPFLMPVPFEKANVDALRAWFAHMKENGVNTLRLMLRNMDLVGALDMAQMAAVREYVNLAGEYGLHFVVVLMEDFSKPPYINRKLLEQIILPRYPGVDLAGLPAHRARFLAGGAPVEDRYLDADVLRCQKEYVRETLPWLGDLPNILCYELENEMYHASGVWIEELSKTIKSVDPETLVTASTGGGGLDSGDPYWFTAKTPIDAYTYHQYPNGALKARAQSKERCPALGDDDLEFGNIVSTLVRYGRACPKPTFYGEVGWYDNYFKLGETPDYLLRDLVWLGILHNPGHLFWLTPGNESAAYKPVAALLAKLDLASFKRDAGERVVDIAHDPGKDYYYYQTNKADYWALLMQNRRALDAGVRLDFALEKKAGALALSNLEAPVPSRRSLTVSKGYQADAVSGNGGERWLVYARNYAGTVEVANKPTAGGYARTRSACDLTLSFDLPGKKYRRTLVDLNDGTTTEADVAGKHVLTARQTDHDFVVVLRAK